MVMQGVCFCRFFTALIHCRKLAAALPDSHCAEMFGIRLIRIAASLQHAARLARESGEWSVECGDN